MPDPDHYTITARQEGNRVAIDITWEATHRNSGILTTQYLTAESAVRFGEQLARIGRWIQETPNRTTIQTMPLATSQDPYPKGD